MKRKMLITGVSGMLGSNIARRYLNEYEVFGWYNTVCTRIPGVQTAQCDLESPDAVSKALQAVEPDVVIHCAARVDVDQMEGEKDAARNINVGGTQNLIEALSPEVHFVHLSTDAVYDGVRGSHCEDSDIEPKNWYGMTKLEAEQVVVEHEHSLILRVNFYGWNRVGKLSLAEWFLDKLQRGEEVGGFVDAFFSPLYTLDLADVIHEALVKKLRGTFNCCSRDSVSKYEFGCMIADLFGYPQDLVSKVSIDDVLSKVPRGKNLSMNAEKLELALGMKLPTVEESLRRFHADHGTALAEKLAVAASS